MNFSALHWTGVALLLLAEATAGLAQAAPPAPAPGDQSSPTEEQTTVPSAGQAADAGGTNPAIGSHAMAQMPVPLNIDSSSLEFSGERPRGSFLQAGLGASATYDDNLLSTSTPRIGGLSYIIAPNFGLSIAKPRLFVEVKYDGGYTFNQRFSAYDQSEQNAQVDLRYRLGPHTNLRIYDRFLMTTGFFDQLQSAGGNLGSGAVQGPNLGIITPFTNRTDNLGTVELAHQYSASDTVGMSVTGDVSHFGQPPVGAATLVNIQTEEADAFYNHRFTARHSTGVAYTFQRLSFDPVVETADTHTILGFHSIYLNPNMVLSFFGGPEYTHLGSQVVATSITLPYVTVSSVSTSLDRWSAGGGASFSWKMRHTSIRASGTRKVSDGGGLLAAVDLTSVIGAVRHQFTRTSSLEVGGIFAQSTALDQGVTTTYREAKSFSASVLWEQMISRNFSASFGYAHNYQQQITAALPPQNTDHNRGWATIAYHFTRPLGQ